MKERLFLLCGTAGADDSHAFPTGAQREWTVPEAEDRADIGRQADRSEAAVSVLDRTLSRVTDIRQNTALAHAQSLATSRVNRKACRPGWGISQPASCPAPDAEGRPTNPRKNERQEMSMTTRHNAVQDRSRPRPSIHGNRR